MFKKISLKAKLLLSYAFCGFCLLMVGAIDFYSSMQVEYRYKHVAEENVPAIDFLQDTRDSIKDIIVECVFPYQIHLTAIQFNDARKNLKASVEAIDKLGKQYAQGDFESPKEKELWEEYSKSWDEYKDLSNQIITLSGTGVKADELHRDHLIEVDWKSAKDRILKAINASIDYQNDETKEWSEIADTIAKRANYIMLLGILIGFGVAFAFGFIISKSLSSTLKNIADNLSQGASAVASASQQASSSSEELSSASTEQAAALQQTAASVEEMTAMINKNAENAKKSQEVAASSQSMAEKGQHAVNDMMGAMDEINNSNVEIMKQIETSNAQIAEIVKVISEIGNKTKVINDIVFQTKLLSFNASVEAARAGEHGKGFAVVAEEVGNLAQMSGTAAKEISSMLDGSIKKVEDIVSDTKVKVEQLIHVGKEKVDTGTNVAKRCKEVLEDMAKSIVEVGSMVNEIAVASQEQATGVQQINEAMGQMDQVTQHNATASRDTASAAEQLSSQAVSLRAMVSELVRTVQGDNGSTVAFEEVRPESKSAKKENVVKMVPKPKASKYQKLKKAAGAEDIPSEDDPRFKDV